MTTSVTFAGLTPHRAAFVCMQTTSFVILVCFCCRLSPTQTMGFRPSARTFRTFLLTVSSVSAKY